MIFLLLEFEFFNDDLNLLILAFFDNLFVQCGDFRVETVFDSLNVQLCGDSFALNFFDVYLLSSGFKLLVFLGDFLFVRVDFHHVLQLGFVNIYGWPFLLGTFIDITILYFLIQVINFLFQTDDFLLLVFNDFLRFCLEQSYSTLYIF